MKLWIGLWIGFYKSMTAKPLKIMVGTRRLELLTSTVSKDRHRNSLILKRTGGSESAQRHSKTSFSTLIEPSKTQKRRGQARSNIGFGFAARRAPKAPGYGV